DQTSGGDKRSADGIIELGVQEITGSATPAACDQDLTVVEQGAGVGVASCNQASGQRESPCRRIVKLRGCHYAGVVTAADQHLASVQDGRNMPFSSGIQTAGSRKTAR